MTAVAVWHCHTAQQQQATAAAVALLLLLLTLCCLAQVQLQCLHRVDFLLVVKLKIQQPLLSAVDMLPDLFPLLPLHVWSTTSCSSGHV